MPASLPAADLPDWVERVSTELLPALQRAGLRLDLRAHLLVQTWLQETGRQGRLPAEPDECRAVLLGLTAKTAREMDLAGAEFEAWCQRPKPGAVRPVEPEPRRGDAGQTAVAPSSWKRWLRRALKWLAWTVGVLALLFGLLVAWVWWDQQQKNLAPELVLDQVKSVSGTVEVDDGAAGRPGTAASASRTIDIPGPSAGRDFPADETLLTRLEQGWSSALQALEPPTRLAGTHPGWWLLVCTLLASLGYLMRRERQQVLARLQTRERLREQQVWAGRRRLPPGAGRGPWREAARLLRRPRAQEGRVLDVPASVRASVAAAGLFRPVWRARQRMPAYLVLIERRRAGEPFATLAHELVQGLAEQGVALQVYEYDADLRWLRPWRRRVGVMVEGAAAPASAARLPLAALEAAAGRAGGQGLIVCSDGRSLLDTRDGGLRPWVARALAAWPQRALLTPLDIDSWGAAEERLAGEPAGLPAEKGAGFLLLPARRAALKTLAQVWAGLPAELADLPGAPRRLPATLRGAALRWLSRQAPPEEEVETLKRELRRWLGPAAYSWLAASAAYPALSAELTGHLADVLEATAPQDPAAAGAASSAVSGALREARLFALAQLPWFRQGQMPDWLRLALLADLPPAELARVRQALEALVEQKADARGELPLGSIATPDAAGRSGLPVKLADWRRSLQARWRREGLTAGEDADSPLRDVIYLGVLDGRVDDLLALRAGAGLVVSLQHGSKLSANPLRWVAAALIFFPGLFLLFVLNPCQKLLRALGIRSSAKLVWDAGGQLTDRVAAGLILILLFPVIVVITTLVLRSDGAPFLSRRHCIGKDGRIFHLLKFRSMYNESERMLFDLLKKDPVARAEWHTGWRLTNDPRITPIGHFLRRTSLDDLPQLVNVLRGEMSLAGPRPLTADEFDKLGLLGSQYISVRPGLIRRYEIDNGDYMLDTLGNQNEISFLGNLLWRMTRFLPSQYSIRLASWPETRRRVYQILHPLTLEVLPAVTAWRATFWLALLALLLWGVVWPYLWPALMPTPAADRGLVQVATGPVFEVGTRFRDCGDATCPWLRVLPAGTFTMGSPEAEPGRDKGEGPQHQVTVAKPFAVMETEVTMGQFRAFVAETRYPVKQGCWIWEGSRVKDDPNTTWRKPFAAADQGDEHPVVCVSWHAVQAFAQWMTKRTRQPYRLLSESEWEYAARAGSRTKYSFGDDQNQLCRHGNVSDRRAKAEVPGASSWTGAECDDGHAYTAPVGNFQSNAFGLYDMHGNASEWVQDCQYIYSDGAQTAEAVEGVDCEKRLVRGGGWSLHPWLTSSAIRARVVPSGQYDWIGFRLAREIPNSSKGEAAIGSFTVENSRSNDDPNTFQRQADEANRNAQKQLQVLKRFVNDPSQFPAARP